MICYRADCPGLRCEGRGALCGVSEHEGLSLPSYDVFANTDGKVSVHGEYYIGFFKTIGLDGITGEKP